MKKKTWIFLICAIGLVLLALCVLLATHVICLFHQMAPATCSQPQTCVYCGHTEGDALSHTWVDATCLAPKTCSACGETEGTAPGHTWIDATCQAPKTCSACEETEGTVAEHVAGDWTYGDINAYGRECTRDGSLYCTLCQELLEEKEEVLEILHEDGKFLLSPEDFTTRINGTLSRILEGKLTAELSTIDKGYTVCLACVVSNGSEEVATISFVDQKTVTFVGATLRDSEKVFDGLICEFSTVDGSDVFSTLWGIAMCCDPQLLPADAAGLDFLSGLVTHNGINYMLVPQGEDSVGFLVTIAQ